MKKDQKDKIVDVSLLTLFMVGVITLVSLCAPNKAEAKETPYDQTFFMTEVKYDIPYNLLKNIANEESRFRDDVITCEISSSNGAMGIMQIMPKVHTEVDPCNPHEAIRYAGEYLAYLNDKTGSWYTAVAAYNWGIGNYRKRYPYIPAYVVNYVIRVWNNYDPVFDRGDYVYVGDRVWD